MAGGSDGRCICVATAPEGGQLPSSGKRRLIRGGGLVTRISDNYEPQFPVVSKDLPCPAARDVVASGVGAVQPLETVCRAPIRRCVISGGLQPLTTAAPLGGGRMMESDDEVLSVGAVRPI